MVPIFTYRDERKLFAVIGTVIVAASIALVQLEAAKAGKPSPITVGVTSAAVMLQTVVSFVVDGVRNVVGTVASVPRLYVDRERLTQDNRNLRLENQRLREALSEFPEIEAIQRAAAREPGGVVADVVGYDPENQSRLVTLDKGSRAGVTRDAGVVTEDGVVGRVIEVDPFESKVLLVTDAASKVPVVVQRGRWWGIATGTNARMQLQYVSQDAKLRIGDRVVTGEGRSFHAGFALGRIAQVYRSEGALYQTALLEPAVALGRLDHVLVLAR